MATCCQPKPQAHRKPKYRPARRRTPTTPGIGKLKSLIWLQVWGEKIPDVGVRPNLTKDEYLERVRAGYLWPLTNTAIADHVSGDRTLYYMSKPDAAEALFMLDVDVLKALGLGTPEGALAYQQYASQRLPFRAHWEASTHGQGRQGFIIVSCELADGTQAPPERIKAAADHLQAYLRYLHAESNADIELVEVKGTPPIIRRQRFTDCIQTVTYGRLAKVPRDLDALLTLETVPLETIEALEIPQDYSKSLQSESRPSTAGSCTGRLITPEDLARLPAFTAVGAEIIGEQLSSDGTSGRLKAHRWAVTPDDFGIALLILTYFQEHPYENGAQPTARIKGLWRALHDAGDVNRAWNNARWKCIRDTLSAAGLLQWDEHRYAVGNEKEDRDGIACKWALTAQLYDLLSSVEAPAEASSTTETGGGSTIYTWLLEGFRDLPRTGQNLIPRRCYSWEMPDTAEDLEFAACMAA